MFCRVEGTGEPLLLIHGFPTASWDWWKLWPGLTARYRCLTVDMLGYGFSAKPRDAAYSIVRQADLQEALLAREGVTGAYRLLAHDYGLSVAQELLARRANVRGVCLLNGGMFPEQHRPVLTQKLLASPLGALIARLSSYGTFARSMRRLWGQAPPPEAELRAMWSLVIAGEGMRVMPKLIGYIAERRRHRALGGRADRLPGPAQADRWPARSRVGSTHGGAVPRAGAATGRGRAAGRGSLPAAGGTRGGAGGRAGIVRAVLTLISVVVHIGDRLRYDRRVARLWEL